MIVDKQISKLVQAVFRRKGHNEIRGVRFFAAGDRIRRRNRIAKGQD